MCFSNLPGCSPRLRHCAPLSAWSNLCISFCWKYSAKTSCILQNVCSSDSASYTKYKERREIQINHSFFFPTWELFNTGHFPRPRKKDRKFRRVHNLTKQKKQIAYNTRNQLNQRHPHTNIAYKLQDKFQTGCPVQACFCVLLLVPDCTRSIERGQQKSWVLSFTKFLLANTNSNAICR